MKIIKKSLFCTSILLILASCTSPVEQVKATPHLQFIDSTNDEIIFTCAIDKYDEQSAKNAVSKISHNYYTFDNTYYSDKTVFDYKVTNIENYISSHDEDKKIVVDDKEEPCYVISAKYSPIDYTINYVGLDGATYDGPSTYNVNSNPNLSSPSKDGYNFVGWFINENAIKELPVSNPSNITLEAKWTLKTYTITYSGLYDFDNPNTTNSFSIEDQSFNLKPLVESNLYVFKGWKLDNEYVTEINPSTLKRSIELVADIEFVTFHAKYYVGDELYIEKTFDYTSFSTYVEPDFPSKEHYQGHWDKSVTELKDYDIYASYVGDEFSIEVYSKKPFDRNDILLSTLNVRYGMTYREVLGAYINSETLYVTNFFFRETSQIVDLDSEVSEGKTIMFIYLEYYEISDLASLITNCFTNPDTNNYAYYLSQDISFEKFGGEITYARFNGILDGRNHSFTNLNALYGNCPNNGGLFSSNGGTIKNLKIVDSEFDYGHVKTNEDKIMGAFVGYNSGTLDNVSMINCQSHLVARVDNEKTPNTSNDFMGLLVGFNQGVISNCLVDDACSLYTVTFLPYKGGVVGQNIDFDYYSHVGLISGYNSGKIKDVTAKGYILTSFASDEQKLHYLDKGVNTYHLSVGGVIGTNHSFMNGYSYGLYSEARLEIDNANEESCFKEDINIGAVVGKTDQSITKSSSTNASIDVHYLENNDSRFSNVNVGGFVGLNECEEDKDINNCYVNDVSITFGVQENGYAYVGGFAGKSKASIINCYATGKIISKSENGYVSLSGFVNADNNAITKNCFADVNLYARKCYETVIIDQLPRGVYSLGIYRFGVNINQPNNESWINNYAYGNSHTKEYPASGQAVPSDLSTLPDYEVTALNCQYMFNQEELYSTDFWLTKLMFSKDIYQINDNAYPTFKNEL